MRSPHTRSHPPTRLHAQRHTLLAASALAATLAACAPPPPFPPHSLTAALTAPRQIARIYTHCFDNLEISAIRNGARRTLGVLTAAQDGALLLSDDMLDVDGA